MPDCGVPPHRDLTDSLIADKTKFPKTPNSRPIDCATTTSRSRPVQPPRPTHPSQSANPRGQDARQTLETVSKAHGAIVSTGRGPRGSLSRALTFRSEMHFGFRKPYQVLSPCCPRNCHLNPSQLRMLTMSSRLGNASRDGEVKNGYARHA